ncbi:MAG: hypothetical protein AAF960_26555 [Bacteroidota bacterium]
MALKVKQNRTIVLNFTEKMYSSFMEDNEIAHETIRQHYAQYPELFPKEMENGYMLNGCTRISKKLGFKMRKIKVANISYRIRPSFILPYFRAKTRDVSKALFLLKFGVPFWALAYVFGKNAMWWYRLYLHFHQFSIVGTTIRKKEFLPTDLLADEHHIRVQGEKSYVATTAGANCFLGMSVCPKADEVSLTVGYADFKEEAADLDAHYQPDTVNTDGWWATQNTWQKLYPTIKVIECFLHAFLKVRDRATKKLASYFDLAADKIWDCYRAESKASLAQQIRRLREWTIGNLPDCPMKQNILKLCKKKKRWMEHLDFPNAHKTSNMMDRLMRAMNRHAFNSQMFHSTISNTSKNFRAFALLYNFAPSCPSAWDESKKLSSPAARLNGFTYHDDWLQNLLIAASLGGFRSHRNPL